MAMQFLMESMQVRSWSSSTFRAHDHRQGRKLICSYSEMQGERHQTDVLHCAANAGLALWNLYGAIH